MILLFMAIILMILQITFFSYHPVFNVKPDLLLLFALNTALLAGPKMGVGMGFVMGMFQDLFLGGVFGIYTIIKTILGGVVGFGEGHFYKRNLLIPSLVIFLVTIIHEFMVILLSEELIFSVNYYHVFISLILPTAVYNTFLGVVIYFILYRIFINRGKFYE